MTRIAVTGGSGKLGRAVVLDLAGHGYDVVNLDRAAPPADAPGDFLRVDLTDYGQTLQALTRIEDRYDAVDGVVHLGAVPAPGLLPNTTTFVNNITCTHHVFAAARAAGITNVVWASSETVLGPPFETPPPYLPVDEDYHPRPESSYSLAKKACRLGLELDATGCDVFVIANADTVMSTPTAELAATVYPDVEVRGELAGTGTLLSIDKARRVLGYEPTHSWRDEVLPDGGA